MATAASESVSASASSDRDERESGPPPPALAIVGMAMRLPGGVTTADKFWELLINGQDGHGPVPESRYSSTAHYNPSKSHTVRTQHGYFLQEHPGEFDAGFFGIPPPYAARMAPQQRLLLEVIWECMENAGQVDWQGKEIGVFVGASGEDWLHISTMDKQSIDRLAGVGAQDFFIANHVSNAFDLNGSEVRDQKGSCEKRNNNILEAGTELTGQSVTYKTACSSSLTGLHEACQALASGECSGAIVAGTAMILAPTGSAMLSDARTLSGDGRCKTFDASADGYGRGEAVNAILIKRLDDALRARDPIRAVIRGSAINSDGKSESLGAPRAQGQEQVIRRAYRKAQIRNLSATGYVECHGTGTQKGDTVETSVLGRVFKDGMMIGTVKPNVGHSEAASGITSVIKAVLMLEKKMIPPNIHLHEPNPKIPFETLKLEVPLKPTPWPTGRAERISINSFGIGGSNAHVIIDSAAAFCREKPDPAQSSESVRPKYLLPVSARCEDALARKVEGIQGYLHTHPEAVQDLAYTLGTRRSHHAHRTFLVTGCSQPSPAPTPSFSAVSLVFGGQGAQWPGMGAELIAHFESFRADMRLMDDSLQRLQDPPTWRIEDELARREGSQIDKAEFAQPLTTALQIGLVNLLRRWGLRPDYSVVGHSNGEIAAAYAAGAIPMESAILISYFRGKAASLQKVKGSMAAVGMGRSQCLPYLVEGVVVACENGPQSITLSGETDKLESVIGQIALTQPGILVQRLPVEIAYHSDMTKPLGPVYEQMIEPHFATNESMLPMCSSATGETILQPFTLGPGYWRQNFESPVRFYAAVDNLIRNEQGDRVFLEIGPHSTLQGPLRQIFEACETEQRLDYIPTLSKSQEPVHSLLTAAGMLYSRHIPLDIAAINGCGRVLTDLPPYPWDHGTVHWHESRIASEWRCGSFPHHELLGTRSVESTGIEPSWRNRLQVENVPWLLDHRVDGENVFPCAAYIAMAGEAVRQVSSVREFSVQDLVIKFPLLLKERVPTEIVTTLRPIRVSDSLDLPWYHFTISACEGSSWHKHCEGQVRAGAHAAARIIADGVDEPFVRKVDSSFWYEALDGHGMQYGETFRGLEAISASPTSYEAAARIKTVQAFTGDYCVHPTVLDYGLQAISIASCNGLSRRIEMAGLPVSIRKVSVMQTPQDPLVLKASLSQPDFQAPELTLAGDVIAVFTEQVAFTIEGAKFASGLARHSRTDPGCGIPLASCLDWKPDIDFLAPAALMPTSIPQTASMRLLTKMAVLGFLAFSETVAGASPASSFLDDFQAWAQTNANRVQEMIQSVLADADITAVDSMAMWPTIEQDIRDVVRSPEPELKPVTSFLRTFLDAVEDQTTMVDYFMDDAGFRSIYEFAVTWVDLGNFFSLLGHSNPTLRVLDIGSETLGTTAGVLSCLCSAHGRRLYSKYTFTSASSSRVEEASERFGDVDAFEARVFDPEKDAPEQGFAANSFHLIILPNNLASECDIQVALPNIRRLLVPGGRLLIREVSLKGLPFVDYLTGLMGVIPGWNVTNEDQVMLQYSPDGWGEALQASGLSKLESIPLPANTYPLTVKHNSMSRAPYPDQQKGVVYLLGSQQCNNDVWYVSLARRLGEAGYTVHWCTLEDSLPADADVISLLDLEKPFLLGISQENYDHLIQYLSESRRTLWITRASQMICNEQPGYGLILGLARTMRYENVLDFGTFEIDDLDFAAAGSAVKVYEKFQRQSMKDGSEAEFEFALLKGIVHIGRFHWQPLEQLHSGPASDTPQTVKLVGRGHHLGFAQWQRSPIPPLAADQVEVKMKYAALNFRDVMASLGVIDDGLGLGLEGAGVVTRVGDKVTNVKQGQAVMLIGSGLFSESVVVPGDFCYPVPSDMSLEEAATLPIAYASAIYSLLHLAQLQKGQSVLIHSGCGAVGQAAIHICQLLHATVYVTVGTELKVQYLMDEFQLPRSHIFSSSEDSFVAGIMHETNGRGVDIVLNSLAGDLLHASWKCVAEFGKMIELGKRDFIGRGMLPMAPFGRNRSFLGVDLLQVMGSRKDLYLKMTGTLRRLLLQGKARPIRPVRVFDAPAAREAFAYMERRTRIGKTLIDISRNLSRVPVSPTKPRPNFSPDAAYLLVGGLGGIGRAVATWMVEHGARQLIFLSRSGLQSDDDRAFFDELRAQGCHPIGVAGSVSNLDDVQRAVSAASARIAGVIQLAAVLKAERSLKTDYASWTAVQSPKVDGAWNLHHALGSQPKLDFFVLASSISSLCGHIGQAHYASANSFVDAFVRYRRSLGLPAVSLNLGAVGDMGCLRRSPDVIASARTRGIRLMSETEVLDALHVAIATDSSSSSISERQRQRQRQSQSQSQVIVAMSSTKKLSDPATRRPWANDARFRVYENIEASPGTAAGGEEMDLIEEAKKYIALAREAPEEMPRERVREALLRVIGWQITGLPRDKLDIEAVARMALDSIVFIEIVSWIRRNLTLQISLANIQTADTVGRLVASIVETVFER
ncbi:ketoacyl-synt-domain-containing protein [Aspergillus egyptiacus]|nr:ketoacyl-synt-domain-containing protein [Aspergillus egyptiacus]